MRLVLVDNNKIDERFSCTYQGLSNMKNNIKFCNQAIQELIDPITYNNTCIIVYPSMEDYYKLMSLAHLLKSNKTRKLFKAIKKDRGKKEVTILNNFPMIKVKRHLNNTYNILTLINSIQILLKEQKKANKQHKKGGYFEQFKHNR